jgi:amidase
LSDTLDVVGTLARNVPDAALFASALSGREALRVKPLHAVVSQRVRVGVCPTYEWDQALPESQQALAQAVQMLQRSNDVTLCDITLPSDFQQLVQAQTQVQLFEQAHNLAHEHLVHSAQLSPRLQGILNSGKAITHAQYDAALQLIARCRAGLAQVFANVDVLLTLSAHGAAPHGLGNTGDPLFCRIWTALQTPSVNLPVAPASNGLPIGLQVVGKPLNDALVLSAAHALQQHFIA